MHKLVFFITFCIFSVFAAAQNNSGQKLTDELTYPEPNQGTLELIQEEGIQDLIGIHIDSNKRLDGVDGYRIQLFLGSNSNARKEATDIKAKVLSLFPNESIYVLYEAPYWRVQAGDFRSKNESLDLYKRLQKTFPSCYPVPVNNIKMSNFK